jgi:hypothetical protein
VESTQEVSKKVGQGKLLPIPDLDKMRVGHAGIYEPDDEDDATDVEVEAITADIPIGVKNCVVVLNIEDGIRTFAKDIIAKKKANREYYQHLPYSITGLFVHYFTKGIEEDFNRTFTKTPLSIDRMHIRSSGASNMRLLKKKGKEL